MVLYIPENKTFSTRKPQEVSKLKRSVSVYGENAKQPGSPTSKSESTEGFDRFASIRRSRRYKKDSETPATTSLTRSASLYSNVRPRTLPSLSKPEDSFKPKAPSTARDDLKVTIRPARTKQESRIEDSRSVGRTGPNNAQSSAIINSTNGTSIVQIRGPSRDQQGSGRSGYGSSKNYLSSSSQGTAERDEGFEESHSSLSETNSQAESHNVPFSSKVQERKPIQRLGGSFRVKAREPPTHHDMNNISVSNNLANKDTSRGSLQSSRSSLASQSTVKENTNVKRSNSISLLGDSKKIQLPSLTTLSNSISAEPKHHSLLTHKNMKNHGVTSFDSKSNGNLPTDSKKSNSKGLAPRILSFMRPTASSTAKDKADNLKSKNKSLRQSFR